jgi:transposase
MVVVGIDAHKRTHTAVAVDDLGRPLGTRTIAATTEGHIELLGWAKGFGAELRFAVEDCRHLSRRLERDLLGAGLAVVRVPPKLMAHARDAARTYGKSDPIDALAVARASLRHEDLPTARLDGAARELRLLVDHREDTVAERTRVINRLRWHLHELDPTFEVAARSLNRYVTIDKVADFLASQQGFVAEIAADLVAQCRTLTEREHAVLRRIEALAATLAPRLLELPGCGPLSAAKIVAETADVTRFRSQDAFAMHNGTAPLPVWSSNVARHRLNRTGNRQLNAAIHRIAITQMRIHPPAQDLLQRRRANGDTKSEALRVLKRRLSNVVYRYLLDDACTEVSAPMSLAA